MRHESTGRATRSRRAFEMGIELKVFVSLYSISMLLCGCGIFEELARIDVLVGRNIVI